jgi:hypothetical protein
VTTAQAKLLRAYARRYATYLTEPAGVSKSGPGLRPKGTDLRVSRTLAKAGLLQTEGEPVGTARYFIITQAGLEAA